MRRVFEKAIAALRRRVMLMVSRAVVKLADDRKSLQQLQLALLPGELRDAVERFQEYGFTSVPLPGAQGILLCVSGNRDHPVAVAVDDRRYRKADLQLGEVAVYDHAGNFIHFRNDGVIHIRAAVKLLVETPLMEVTGDIIDRTADAHNTLTVDAMRGVYDQHIHPENDNGGPTNPPIQQMPSDNA
jgi:phage baseplate assembly protein V